MSRHYSQPKGFVGRNICFGIFYDDVYYGGIVAGSALMYLKGRDEFFGINNTYRSIAVQYIINNTFYHVERVNGQYPVRNFTVRILEIFRERALEEWYNKYYERPVGFEALVELPRTGEVYLRDGWTEVGQTIGYTCKREAGKGTDTWTGKRVWNTESLRPKRIFCRMM